MANIPLPQASVMSSAAGPQRQAQQQRMIAENIQRTTNAGIQMIQAIMGVSPTQSKSGGSQPTDTGAVMSGTNALQGLLQAISTMI